MAVLSFQHVVDIDIVMLFLGLTQLFGVLNQFNLTKSIDSKENSKVNKGVGIFSIILGLTITVAVLIKASSSMLY